MKSACALSSWRIPSKPSVQSPTRKPSRRANRIAGTMSASPVTSTTVSTKRFRANAAISRPIHMSTPFCTKSGTKSDPETTLRGSFSGNGRRSLPRASPEKPVPHAERQNPPLPQALQSSVHRNEPSWCRRTGSPWRRAAGFLSHGRDPRCRRRCGTGPYQRGNPAGTQQEHRQALYIAHRGETAVLFLEALDHVSTIHQERRPSTRPVHNRTPSLMLTPDHV